MRVPWLLLLLSTGLVTLICAQRGAIAGQGTQRLTDVELQYLAEHESAYFDKTVLVHGCFVDAFHGEFIHRCGDLGPHIVLLDIPDAKWKLIGDMNRPMRLLPDKIKPEVEGEADFVGTIVQQNAKDQLGNEMKNKIFVLQLQDVRNPQIFHKH